MTRGDRRGVVLFVDFVERGVTRTVLARRGYLEPFQQRAGGHIGPRLHALSAAVRL